VCCNRWIGETNDRTNAVPKKEAPFVPTTVIVKERCNEILNSNLVRRAVAGMAGFAQITSSFLIRIPNDIIFCGVSCRDPDFVSHFIDSLDS
jgi:hypothetical protein